jgi:hypothetical protein
MSGHGIAADVYRCTCTPGWTGGNCAVDTDECSSKPCQNSGVCIDSNVADGAVPVGAYRCNCSSTWIGTNCSAPAPPPACVSQPCVNGRCADLGSWKSYRCKCSPGFSGINCDTDINECQYKPCLNGAVCQDKVNAYVCTCKSGFAGADCNQKVEPQKNHTSTHNYRPGQQRGDINECRSRPCQHGAKCRDQIQSYTCVCTSGFSGHDCEASAKSAPDSENVALIAGGAAFVVAMVVALVMCRKKKSQKVSKWQEELSDGLDVGKFSHVGQQHGEPAPFDVEGVRLETSNPLEAGGRRLVAGSGPSPARGESRQSDHGSMPSVYGFQASDIDDDI